MPRPSGANKAVLVQRLPSFLHERYPKATCRLVFRNDYEALISIVLSAQTSDESVNKTTPRLFRDFPTWEALAGASLIKIERRISSLGLYRSKARYLKEIALTISTRYESIVPSTRKELEALPGVGHKTAGVFLMERRGVPSLPVDTHVERISKRLELVEKSKNPSQIEAILEKTFPVDEWIFLHHALIAFGRDLCSSKAPRCLECPLRDLCPYLK